MAFGGCLAPRRFSGPMLVCLMVVVGGRCPDILGLFVVDWFPGELIGYGVV